MVRPGEILRGNIHVDKWEPDDLSVRPVRGFARCSDEYTKGYMAAIEDVLKLLESLHRNGGRSVQDELGENR